MSSAYACIHMPLANSGLEFATLAEVVDGISVATSSREKSMAIYIISP